MVALKPGPRRRAPRTARWKQERRGGIETTPSTATASRGMEGSRNAVVALKLRFGYGEMVDPATKQERRGGIEREGHILVAVEGDQEAGTPWWH